MGVRVRREVGKSGWWLIATHRGRRKKKRFNDRAAAMAAARKLEQALALGGMTIVPTGQTVAAYFEQWVEQHVRPFRKPSTLVSYLLGWERYLKPALGDLALAGVTRSHVRDLVSGMMRQGLARNTVRAMIAPLSTMYARAIDDGLVRENPALRVLPRQRGQEHSRKAHPLTREQAARLLAACREQFPQWFPFVFLLSRSGVRVGEALALQWGDVDFQGRFLYLRRQWHRGSITDLKGGRQGKIDLSNQLAQVLLRARPEDAKDTALLFPNAVGKPINPSNFRTRVWLPLLQAAELPLIRMHDLRHTFATHLLESGADLLYVQRQLRHHSVEITQRFYGHVQSGYRRDVNKLDDEGAGEGQEDKREADLP